MTNWTKPSMRCWPDLYGTVVGKVKRRAHRRLVSHWEATVEWHVQVAVAGQMNRQIREAA